VIITATIISKDRTGWSVGTVENAKPWAAQLNWESGESSLTTRTFRKLLVNKRPGHQLWDQRLRGRGADLWRG
jgi:hypothetical protein